MPGYIRIKVQGVKVDTKRMSAKLKREIAETATGVAKIWWETAVAKQQFNVWLGMALGSFLPFAKYAGIEGQSQILPLRKALENKTFLKSNGRDQYSRYGPDWDKTTIFRTPGEGEARAELDIEIDGVQFHIKYTNNVWHVLEYDAWGTIQEANRLSYNYIRRRARSMARIEKFLRRTEIFGFSSADASRRTGFSPNPEEIASDEVPF